MGGGGAGKGGREGGVEGTSIAVGENMEPIKLS